MGTMEKPTHKKIRIVSVVAATAIALACGTNYGYSAWAPQFAEKLQLSATQSNIIGTSANLGMYAFGIPMGVITDRKSPRLTGVIGMICLFVGYYPIRIAYVRGYGSMSVGMISFWSFISGVGSCAAFQAALKTATLNWPTHRGTASAFPTSAFGLSAFFYTLIAGIFFPGDTSSLLLFLSLGTSLVVLASLPFLLVVDGKHGTGYAAVPTSGRPRRDSNRLHRTRSNGSKDSSRVKNTSADAEPNLDDEQQSYDSDESSALLSAPGDLAPPEDSSTNQKANRSHSVDITGLTLLRKTEFWEVWVLIGLLTGVGLMTINNIGHNVQALWNHYDPTRDKAYVEHRQLWHVSIISIGSFVGRLSSGIGSDLIVKRLHMSRYWCAAMSGAVFTIAQICGFRIENPHQLFLLSGLCGFAYGMLFGVMPAIVIDSFGSDGFAVNWGFMTLAPVVSGNIFNLFYGAVYDAHSEVQPTGERSCDEGLVCYRAAYYVTFGSSFFGILACLWGIHREHLKKRRLEEDHLAHRDA